MSEPVHKIVHVQAADVWILRPELPEAVAILVAKPLIQRPEEFCQTGVQIEQALTFPLKNALQQSIQTAPAAVVYDLDCSPAEQNLSLIKIKVLPHPQQLSPASRSVAVLVG